MDENPYQFFDFINDQLTKFEVEVNKTIEICDKFIEEMKNAQSV